MDQTSIRPASVGSSVLAALVYSEIPSFTVSEIIGPFLRVGGLFVLIGGAWIFMFDYTAGVALQINDLGTASNGVRSILIHRRVVNCWVGPSRCSKSRVLA